MSTKEFDLVLYACNEGPEQILGSYGIPQTVDDLTDYLRGAVLGDNAEVSEGQEDALKEWSKAITENEVVVPLCLLYKAAKIGEKGRLVKAVESFSSYPTRGVTSAQF